MQDMTTFAKQTNVMFNNIFLQSIKRKEILQSYIYQTLDALRKENFKQKGNE